MCTVRERFSAYFMLKSLKCVLDIHLRTIMEKSPHFKSEYSYLEDKSIKIVFREVISTVGHTKAELMVFISDIRISEFDLSRLHGQRFSSKVKYLRRILDPKSNWRLSMQLRAKNFCIAYYLRGLFYSSIWFDCVVATLGKKYDNNKLSKTYPKFSPALPSSGPS